MNLKIEKKLGREGLVRFIKQVGKRLNRPVAYKI